MTASAPVQHKFHRGRKIQGYGIQFQSRTVGGFSLQILVEGIAQRHSQHSRIFCRLNGGDVAKGSESSYR